VLLRTSALGCLAADAGRHHERLDGSGYHRGSDASALSAAARLLAAADVMHALQEPRPHRPAYSREEAARIVCEEAAAGRLDGDAAGAVVEAAGARRPLVERPAGLTRREVEVLRLAARGLSRQEIAVELFVSPKTVQHHLSHIYDKTGRRTRAGAALFAMEHGLLEPAA
jgi:HD-GYP domain-containing protein (c-di-GMP phosphodiesterase class II)